MFATIFIEFVKFIVFCLEMGSGGGIIMSSIQTKTKNIRCPNCTNKMIANEHTNGALSGKCNVCKAIIYSKQHSSKERLIRIINT